METFTCCSQAPFTLLRRNLKNGIFLIKCFSSILRGTEEFENGVFTLKPHQMFSLHTMPETFENATVKGHLDLCLRKTRAGKSHHYRDFIVFKKLRFQNVFGPRENAKPSFSNSSGLKSVFEKLRFRDGLVWTIGRTCGQSLIQR